MVLGGSGWFVVLLVILGGYWQFSVNLGVIVGSWWLMGLLGGP